ncbi:preprotein translocase subunit YajC [Jiangella sp. DSM 45060]|uniref:preprotein translocase subunit YajC n=1 Tax=Jiangella sp. DSM 45060 TaxID=1798224 RepID=UPI00087A3B53|nr:preprotein translocase subunit YajC [Jiangella sp. DSM 45060]SDT05544.1 protein translocase subunit yajC [Jiangella sp. DSM 45060]
MEALLLPILLIAVFYFLLIRPQQKQRRQMVELQQSVQAGTKVMTTAGLLATVVEVDDDEVVLEVAPGVHSRYVRRAIANVVQPQEPVAPVHDDIVPDTAADADEAPKHEPAQAKAEDRTNGDDVR